jgi:hypothetical protein
MRGIVACSGVLPNHRLNFRDKTGILASLSAGEVPKNEHCRFPDRCVSYDAIQ